MRRWRKWMISFVVAAGAIGSAGAETWAIPQGVKAFEVEGYPVAYAEAGSGVPIVMLHGTWVDHRLFSRQLAEFGKTHRAIAVSLRHHWPEPWDGKEGDYTIERQARDVVGLIRGLGLGKVHLLGHSRGGAVAAAVARQAPEVVRTLILAEASGLDAVATDPAGVRARMEGGNNLAASLRGVWERGSTRAELAQRGWEGVSGPGSWAAMPPSIQQMFVDNILTVTVPLFQVGQTIVSCEQVGRFAFPVMLVQSSRPAKTYVDINDGLRRCNAAIAPPVEVPDSNHNMHLSNTAFFNRAVLDFIGTR